MQVTKLSRHRTGRQFEPYPYRRMRLHDGGALAV